MTVALDDIAVLMTRRVLYHYVTESTTRVLRFNLTITVVGQILENIDLSKTVSPATDFLKDSALKI